MVAMFCSVTEQSPEDARSLLEAYDWSLEAAVNGALAGDDRPNAARPAAADDAGDDDEDYGEEEDMEEEVFGEDDEDKDEEDEDYAYELESEEDKARAAAAAERAAAARARPPDGGAPRVAGGGLLLRVWGRVRGALGPWLYPVVRALLGSVAFVARLLLVAPLRLLFGGAADGRGGLLDGGGGGGRLAGGGGGGYARDRESLNALGAAEARRFIARFEARHAPAGGGPPFAPSSLQTAIETAKAELRYVLVYVAAEEGEGTADGDEPSAAFSHHVLCSALFGALLEAHFVLWAADLSAPGGARVARSLGLRDGPALAVVAYGELTGGERSELRVLERLPPARCRAVEAVVDALIAVVQRHEPMVVAARAERSEREMARMLRADQVCTRGAGREGSEGAAGMARCAPALRVSRRRVRQRAEGRGQRLWAEGRVGVVSSRANELRISAVPAPRARVDTGVCVLCACPHL